jgi:parallel beta-helix repeat protein
VSGNITENTNWTVINSPYLVVGKVQLFPGAKLTIDPGVIVKFNEGQSIVIGGELVCSGTVDDSIIFTANCSSPYPGYWGGIQFIDSSRDAIFDKNGAYVSGSILKYCVIEYGSNSINCVYSSPFICNSTLQNNSRSLILVYNNSVITFNTIKNNTHTGNGTGFYLLNSDPRIENNSIKYNYAQGSGGAFYLEQSSPIINNNNIYNNQSSIGGGFFINSGSPIIRNNNIEENLSGAGSFTFIEYGSTPLIENNIIKNNHSSYGSSVEIVSGSPVIIYNNIEIADKYFIEVYRGNENINALNNYWGYINADSISNHIYDYYDDITLSQILFIPFLTEQYVKTINCSSNNIFSKYRLLKNYPNPFNSNTRISYQLPKTSFVILSIIDINGRLIKTLVSERQDAGNYSINWNSNNLSSGVYFYKIDAGEFKSVKKCLLIK